MNGAELAADILEHYGVKGMRWGVRKRSANGKARTTFAKAPSKLSDAELTKRIKRMETEKRYNQLNRQDVSRGKEAATEVLTNSGKKIATTILTSGGLFVVQTALASKFGGDVGQAVTRRLK